MEALTAIVFSSSVAVAFLFLPVEQAEARSSAIFTRVGTSETSIAVVVTLVLILVIRRIYPEIVLINVSDDLARSSGLDVNRYNLISTCS